MKKPDKAYRFDIQIYEQSEKEPGYWEAECGPFGSVYGRSEKSVVDQMCQKIGKEFVPFLIPSITVAQSKIEKKDNKTAKLIVDQLLLDTVDQDARPLRNLAREKLLKPLTAFYNLRAFMPVMALAEAIGYAGSIKDLSDALARSREFQEFLSQEDNYPG